MPRDKSQIGESQTSLKESPGPAGETLPEILVELMPESGRDPQPEIVQEHPEDAPPGWADVQEKIAASVGLSVLLVDGRQPPALVASNNNSICHAFQSSPEYVGLCDPYCGDAHRRAMSAGSVVRYKCHAGLQCFTMPVPIGREQNLAAIGGRAFVTGADYRSLVDRFRAGELNDLLTSKPFENVIFAESQRLDQLSARLDKAARNFDEVPSSPVAVRTATKSESGRGGILPADRLAAPVTRTERISSGGNTILDVSTESARNKRGQMITTHSSKPKSQLPTATAATEVKGEPDLQREVNRLRHELAYRANLAESLTRFLERISSTEPDKTYLAILTHSKELLKAERASLMVFDEDRNEISLRAAVGLGTEESEVGPMRLGEGISGRVLESGLPIVVQNLETAAIAPAPAGRAYKTKSFISYPITIRGRKIGVLNVTDKMGGGTFDEVDLSLLEIIGPQIAVALERAEWQERATQFQLMSITDPLTGLLNRRYLEERLTEELNRSTRYGYPMSCLMIDIDDFKSYNDLNGHQAGDVALKITAHCLKAALRSADVACR
ncbi:MAG: diguanylate cyclase, partial [Pyrinomonadaceae bacterium]